MMLRYKIENAVVLEIHFAETEAGALWLARWVAASFAARAGIVASYTVVDLATSPPTRLRTVSWDPPSWAVRPPWPYGWSYSEY